MGIRIPRKVARRILREDDPVDPEQPLRLEDAQFARVLARRLDPEQQDPELTAGRLRATVELAAVLRERLESQFEAQPAMVGKLLGKLESRLSGATVSKALRLFSVADELSDDEPSEDATIEQEPADEASADGEPAPRHVRKPSPSDPRFALTELLLYWVLSSNPASAALVRRLLGEEAGTDTSYRRFAEELEDSLDRPAEDDESWADLMRSLIEPIRAAPDSPGDQLRFVVEKWQGLAAAERDALLSSLDLIAEEEAPRFPPGPGPIEIPTYDDLELDSARYSDDRHWMQRLVLLAKNCFVWLDQLSRDYSREIRRLDQIPDRELDRLADWGISGLWLIGVWERSRASAEIKHRLGNEEALASAYSLFQYEIAADLGGDEALEQLRSRALERGIRLAADMVPNHLGIDSKWMLEHPDRFLSVADSPFPGYSFGGPDLSGDPRFGIYLEDHYYDRSDAAVVFKRVDRVTGEERFIYHGNDGTSTPWNDTAQLDYLNAETREAVIQSILAVARRFPIIRFDAAMTLARRHIQRLWYPQPGSGGAIPSRSDHALTPEEFNRALPNEFWREVVDRVAEEAPDTLLLAEAFWLMEGYFVRSLGMHRVYNSAFMNLLRDGETAKLRSLIQETLDFDPQILERYVNFLSNPDEDTAIDQFGSGDRYFGASVTMATLPGLPLVAHGQVEGYREKYGMEFSHPQLREEIDDALYRRHRREVFPLFQRRGWFSGVEHFRLLEAQGEDAEAAADVLAFANGSGPERSIVLFNNGERTFTGRITGISGWLEIESSSICRFRDGSSGLRYLVSATEAEQSGLPVELAPFESRVLLDFRAVLPAVQEPFQELAERLRGHGVASVEAELSALELEPFRSALATLLAEPSETRPEQLENVLRELLALDPQHFDAADLEHELVRGLELTDDLAERAEQLPWPESERMEQARGDAAEALGSAALELAGLRVLSVSSPLRPLLGLEATADGWQRLFLDLLAPLASDRSEDTARASRILALALNEGWLAARPAPGRQELASMLDVWVGRSDALLVLGLNEHGGQRWVRREELEALLRWRGLCGLCGWLMAEDADTEEASLAALAWLDSADRLRTVAEHSGFAVDRMRRRLVAPTPKPAD